MALDNGHSADELYAILDAQAADDLYCKMDHYVYCNSVRSLIGNSGEIIWRVVRAAQLAFTQPPYSSCNCGTFRADAFHKRQLKFLDAPANAPLIENCPYANKYYAISCWALAVKDFPNSLEAIDYMRKCKKRMDVSFVNLPKDAELLRLRGMLNFTLANVNWFDKAIGFLAGASLPKATLEDAYKDLNASNAIQPDDAETCLYLAKVRFAMKNTAQGKFWLRKGLAAKNARDQKSVYEALNTLALKYADL